MKFTLALLFVFGFAQAAKMELSNGATKYSLADTGADKNVVILHGGTLSSWTVSSYSKPLKDAGFNVLRYDMYGMGDSDALEINKYTRDIFVQQLTELLLRLNWHGPNSKPLYVVGVGTGASIAAAYAAEYPNAVERIFAVAPAYDVKSTKSWTSYAIMEGLRWFPSWDYLRNKVKAKVRTGMYEIFEKLHPFKAKVARKKFDKIIETEKFIESLTRRLIGDVFTSYAREYNDVATIGIPMMITVGTHDVSSPGEHIDRILKGYNQPRLIEVVYFLDAGNELPSDKPKQLMTLAAEFFAKDINE